MGSRLDDAAEPREVAAMVESENICGSFRMLGVPIRRPIIKDYTVLR